MSFGKVFKKWLHIFRLSIVCIWESCIFYLLKNGSYQKHLKMYNNHEMHYI